MMALTKQQPGPRRDPKLLRRLNSSHTLGRLASVNQLMRVASTLAPKTRFPALRAFLPQNLWPWLKDYLKNAFTKRYPFPAYTAGHTGIYRLTPAAGRDAISIAIAGDWGTGTQEAQNIVDLMAPSSAPAASMPDLTIHLGDVYYVGDDAEVAENFFGTATNGFEGVKWQHGAQGSFALNGNHEMYANGKAYFTTILDSLGMPPGPQGGGQMASFFCLETDWWRIIALDTGYNSVGVPILSQIPLINRIPFIGGDCHLDQKVLDWLRDTVKPAQSRKATLLLSHHQYYTAFKDGAYTKPAKQLAEFFRGQDVIWMWGHEHRLGIYDKHDTGAGITAYGRCVGHGGMPVETSDPDPQKAPVKFYDKRTHLLDDGSPVGENGFVVLTIDGPTMNLHYRDSSNTELLAERFIADGDGALQYLVVTDPGILQQV
jgi:hypothetical protein